MASAAIPLRKKYLDFLSGEIKDIENLWDRALNNGEADDVLALRRKVRDLAGSGATFGFPSVSEAAHAMDLMLSALVEQDRAPSPSESFWFCTCLGMLKRASN